MSTERITKLHVHDLTEREILILRQEIEDRKKSTATTWILWFFLGWAGGHRFYQGRVGTGIAMLLTLGAIGLWTVIDLFLISGMLKANKRKVEKEVLDEIAAMRKA
jgi:TM2 domain-containing membrane protein YozV|tara:strand:+ start:212 stop:529 length:318 start_codon:yes stop_codon:yes gene_type:complete